MTSRARGGSRRQEVGNADLVDLHPVLGDELKALRTRRGEDRDDDHIFLTRRRVRHLRLLPCPPPESELVFLSWHGTPWVDIRKSWVLALKAAGLYGHPGLGFHSCRHSFSAHFLEGGGSLTDLMMQLGHSKLETTQVYAAGVSERRRATVMGMEFGVMSTEVAASTAAT